MSAEPGIDQERGLDAAWIEDDHGSPRLVSVVVPAYNEAESLAQLCAEVTEALTRAGELFEILLVDDGSTDTTRAVLAELRFTYGACLRVIQLRRNFGKSVALMEGFRAACGDVVVTIDADLQDVPAELPRLLAQLDCGCDIVSGWKQDRQDGFVKRFTSKIFNFAVNRISIAQLHDHDCGLKVMRAEAAQSLDLYGTLYRFMVPLLEANGYRATEVPVRHRARVHGVSKFGFSRFFEGFFDLVTVFFLTRFRQRPLHFFGYIGLALISVGVLLGVYLAAYKFIGHHEIGHRPLLFGSIMLIIVGVQIFSVGIIGEHVNSLARSNRQAQARVEAGRDRWAQPPDERIAALTSQSSTREGGPLGREEVLRRERLSGRSIEPQ